MTDMATLTIHPDYRAPLEAAGLATFDALYAAGERGLVDGHQSRSVSRIELGQKLAGAGGERVVIYLKRQWGRAARASWRDLLALRWPVAPARREWRIARRLMARGIPVAAPVAWGYDSGPGGPRAMIAFREVPGISLARWLLDSSGAGGVSISSAAAGSTIATRAAFTIAACSPAVRRAVAEKIGLTLRHVHDCGLAFPDFYAKHIFVSGLSGPGDIGGPSPEVRLIDVQRVGPLVPWREARDLSALLVTAISPRVTHTDRLRVLRAYLGTRRIGPRGRRLVRQIDWYADHLKGRGQDPSLMASRRIAPPGMVPVAEQKWTPLDSGRMMVNCEFLPALRAAGLTSLDAVMQQGGGVPYREVPGRSTVRIEIADPGGGSRAIYLKRYTAVPWRERLRRRLVIGSPVSLARQEAANLYRVTDAGIASMHCIAFGEELARGARQERSFLITEEIAGATQADKYCEAAFAADRSREATAARRRIISGIGELARRLHAAHLSHRDFYLCHILVRPVPAASEVVLHLIDLARVTFHRRGLERRWIIKDLAALLFSSWPSASTFIRSPVFTRTDGLRFAHAYFAARRLTPDQKRLLRAVIAKARRMARRESAREARQRATPTARQASTQNKPPARPEARP